MIDTGLNDSFTNLSAVNKGLWNNVVRQDATDLNTLDTQGIYYVGNAGPNGPDNAGYWFVFVLKASGSGDALQIVFSMVTDKLYRRRRTSSGWGTTWTALTFS